MGDTLEVRSLRRTIGLSMSTSGGEMFKQRWSWKDWSSITSNSIESLNVHAYQKGFSLTVAELYDEHG
jgi:hypothetical protein